MEVAGGSYFDSSRHGVGFNAKFGCKISGSGTIVCTSPQEAIVLCEDVSSNVQFIGINGGDSKPALKHIGTASLNAISICTGSATAIEMYTIAGGSKIIGISKNGTGVSANEIKSGTLVTGYSENGDGVNGGTIDNSNAKTKVTGVGMGTGNGLLFENLSHCYGDIGVYGGMNSNSIDCAAQITINSASALSGTFTPNGNAWNKVIYIAATPPLLPIFDDRFGDTVTVDNYNTFYINLCCHKGLYL